MRLARRFSSAYARVSPSQVAADLRRLRDASGNPLLAVHVGEGLSSRVTLDVVTGLKSVAATNRWAGRIPDPSRFPAGRSYEETLIARKTSKPGAFGQS